MKLLVAVPVLLLNTFWDCGGHKQPADPLPEVEFKVIKYELTVDAQLQQPWVRYIIEQVPADSLPGLNNRKYVQVKTFDLWDTLTFSRGRHFRAHYELKPYRIQTPWKTRYEWLSVPPVPPGYTPNPEVELQQISPL
jgi:hypothetical protein